MSSTPFSPFLRTEKIWSLSKWKRHRSRHIAVSSIIWWFLHSVIPAFIIHSYNIINHTESMCGRSGHCCQLCQSRFSSIWGNILQLTKIVTWGNFSNLMIKYGNVLVSRWEFVGDITNVWCHYNITKWTHKDWIKK